MLILYSARRTFVVCWILMTLINLIPGCKFRTDEEGEIVGVDDAECGEWAVSRPLLPLSSPSSSLAPSANPPSRSTTLSTSVATWNPPLAWPASPLTMATPKPPTCSTQWRTMASRRPMRIISALLARKMGMVMGRRGWRRRGLGVRWLSRVRLVEEGERGGG